MNLRSMFSSTALRLAVPLRLFFVPAELLITGTRLVSPSSSLTTAGVLWECRHGILKSCSRFRAYLAVLGHTC
jgi:hypothetical protein